MRFNEELGQVFKILSLNGLHPVNTGARVSFTNGKTTITDGPFIETKEVLGGYWLIEAPSKAEVVQWTKRCPAEEGDVIESGRFSTQWISRSKNSWQTAGRTQANPCT